MKTATKSLGDLGPSLVLAPERWLVAAEAEGTPLGELVEERIERAKDLRVVLDTTHARDGVIDVAAALRASLAPAKSHKKRAEAGDLLVSRLRPYLRQVALVHPSALRAARVNAFAVSTEFYVLRPRAHATGKRGAGASLAWLLPWLLSDDVQAALAAAQEGGHHPRVPRESLFALRVGSRPSARTAQSVEGALAAHYESTSRLTNALRAR